MCEDEAVGGQVVPVVVDFACKEMFFAANYALTGYMGLTHSAAKVIEVYGTDEQKERYMVPLYEGRYAGTMNLTEDQAGSDVGSIRTKAARNADGSFSIQGTKIFITGGNQDVTENLVHIVLARIEGDPEGTRGLSCFVVSQKRVDGEGGAGEENDVTCSGIEHKMGFKGSATCVLNYGDNGNCRGELLGPERKGIVVMFHMMNEQRILVGLQGLAQGSTAYLHALGFARERMQGPVFGTKGPEQVPIIRHPDVRRNLLWMKCNTEGVRALIYYTVYCMDRMSVAVEEAEERMWQDLVDMLTPICKAYATDRGFDVCTRSLQVHGGYGYCKEYGVEQFTRDSKIATIFEGTNGIQALDLFARKIRMRGGAALNTLLSRMRSDVEEAAEVPELAGYADDLSNAISSLEALTRELLDQVSSGDAYLATSWATPYLEIFGDIVLGWMFLWQARVACEKRAESGKEDPFYASKLHTARFYVGSLLPLAHGKMEAIRKNEPAFSSMDDSMFPDPA
jgi:alkylation response protein AidB-like acyl-CoA dehydrogenase